MARPHFWAPVSPLQSGYRGLTYPGHTAYAIDINRGYGTTDWHDPVLCSAAGHVSRLDPSYGLVEVLHWSGWSTLYAHLDRVNVTLGQQVWAGQELGLLGRKYPGVVELSPHLHYQQLLNGRTQQVTFEGVPYPISQLRALGLVYGPPIIGHLPTV